MRSKKAKQLIPNPLCAALTVYTVIFTFFSFCSLVAVAVRLVERA